MQYNSGQVESETGRREGDGQGLEFTGPVLNGRFGLTVPSFYVQLCIKI
jgi:hypothetical protein